MSSILNGEKQVERGDSLLISYMGRRDHLSMFGVIGVEGVEQRDESYHDLKKLVRLKGYGIVELALLHGKDSLDLSRFLLVPGISKKDLLSFAQLYSQSSLLLRKGDGLYSIRREEEGPPDKFKETRILQEDDYEGLLLSFGHIVHSPLSIFEREQVGIWREWYISVKRSGDDRELWKRIF